MQLASGQKTSLQVGDLPRPVATYLRCHPAIVFLGHKEMLKISKKHTEITSLEFLQLPFLIKDGHYYEDEKRRNCVTIYHKLPDDPRLYIAGLKAVDHGCEVWVQTFYRIDDSSRRNPHEGYASDLVVADGRPSAKGRPSLP